ncbi:hypothetical protein [Luteimonas abyssi]|uniref:hypothetical protein n=1 Tax=Luteimonas abyssi TaxID=1247514 RepID=UPI000737B432|nr:hypothetical protein [Luteimonas abyssi]
MLLELIAIIAAGFGVAGIALSLNFVLGKRLPKWIIPASAGAGMLAMAIWLEYSWLDRTTGSFPEGVEIASTHQVRSWYRPWTYAVPLTTRLIAIDRRLDRHHTDRPGQVLSQIILAGRWEPTRQFASVFDCPGRRRADLVDGVTLGDDGAPRNARWVTLPADDTLLRTACRQ